jgi:hypothetical protein
MSISIAVRTNIAVTKLTVTAAAPHDGDAWRKRKGSLDLPKDLRLALRFLLLLSLQCTSLTYCDVIIRF